MIITALDVFESDGTTLKKYFETNETVCAVLGWLNKGAENFPKVKGLNTNYTKNITLNIGHQPTNNFGAAYGGLNINVDSDPIMENDLWSDQKGYRDGNLFSKGMQYFLVHEFFHYAQDMTVNNPFPSNYDPKFYKKHEWVNEGTARMFEGIVYEEEVKSLYSEPGYINFLGKTYIADTLKDGIKTNAKKQGKNEAYKTFAFWKLVRNKCNLNMADMLRYPLSGNNSLQNSTCSGVSGIDSGDSLSNLFVYYNWAMLLKKDFPLLDGVDSKVPFTEHNISLLKEFEDKNFKTTTDMKSMVGSSLPPFSAKSFLITKATLNSSQNINLNFKSSGDAKLVAVRVSSGVNDTFTMDSSTQEYRLEDKDKNGSLFLTLVNTTDKEIDILDLNLTDKRFTRDANTDIVTDHQRGLQWQDETLTWLDSWYGANRHCTALTLGGYNDWRVPTYIDLVSIVDQNGPPYIYKEFEHLGAVGYWSSELNGGVFPDTEKARVVNFGLATQIWINTSSHINTRCVRDYQIPTARLLSKQSMNVEIDNNRVLKKGNYEDFYQDNNKDMGGQYINY